MSKSTTIKTLREAQIFGAGLYAGMRNVWMSHAATVKGAQRAQFLRFARDHHHVYLARLREADGAPGYRAPTEQTVSAPPVLQPVRMMVRQAS